MFKVISNIKIIEVQTPHNKIFSEGKSQGLRFLCWQNNLLLQAELYNFQAHRMLSGGCKMHTGRWICDSPAGWGRHQLCTFLLCSVMLSLNQNTLIKLNMNIQFSSFFCSLNFVCPPCYLVPCASYAFKFVGPPKCLWYSQMSLVLLARYLRYFQGSGIFGPIDIADL